MNAPTQNTFTTQQAEVRETLGKMIESLQYVSTSLASVTTLDVNREETEPRRMTPIVMSGLGHVIDGIRFMAEEQYSQLDGQG